MTWANDRLGALAPSLARALEPERALRWATIALIALLAWQVANMIWAIAAPIGPIGRPIAQQASPRAMIDPSAIVRFDPFFRATQADGPAQTDLSQLGLVLFAVRAGGPDGGAAIIQIPGRGQRSISINEEVMPGIVVRSVHTDYALLERNGATYQLPFPNSPAQGGLAPGGARQSVPPAQGDAMLRVASTINPEELMRELALQARIENGEVTGYTLREGRPGQVLERLGLRPGDVLLEVNNRRLVDDDRVAELQEELMSRPEAVIRYERDGEVRTATVRIELP